MAQLPEAAEMAGLLVPESELLLTPVLPELALVELSLVEALSLAAAAAPATGAGVAPEPPLKSVAYQPEPLS